MKYHKLDIDPRTIKETAVTVAKPIVNVESGQAFQESFSEGGMRYLLPRIEAIHAGATRNHTHYPADKLRGHRELNSGVYSWLDPYPKPVIYNHDVETKATGRVQSAGFSEFTSAGRPGIIVVPKITDPQAIEGILGGRLLTVSIGANTDAAICSICGTDIINEGFCGHYKGEEYDGVKAEWIVGNVWFDELSWVNVPADQDAMIIDQGGLASTAESFAFNGKDIINLGKNTTEWLVDATTAIAEGLQPADKKGDSPLLTQEQIEKLQQDLAEATEAKAALEVEKQGLTEQNEQLKTEKDEAVAEKAAVEATLAEKETDLETKEAALVELTSTKEALELEKTALEESLAQEKTAREEALTENTRLAAEIHTALAERVVDLRVSLGKEADREEAVKTYVSRSTESLNDSLSDLLKESVAPVTPATEKRTPEKVEHPASGVAVTESTKATELTAEDVLMQLFGSKKN